MFVSFLENLNFTSKNRTANRHIRRYFSRACFDVPSKSQSWYFNFLQIIHYTFYDNSRHCLVMYMLLNSCLMFISCVQLHQMMKNIETNFSRRKGRSRRGKTLRSAFLRALLLISCCILQSFQLKKFMVQIDCSL